MKRTVIAGLLVMASVVVAQAETKTVEGLLVKSEGGSRSFVLKNPNTTEMGKQIYTGYKIQSDFAKYEGKRIRVTGDVLMRGPDNFVIDSMTSIEVIGE